MEDTGCVKEVEEIQFFTMKQEALAYLQRKVHNSMLV